MSPALSNDSSRRSSIQNCGEWSENSNFAEFESAMQIEFEVEGQMREFSLVALVLIRRATAVLMNSFQDVGKYHPERHYMRGPGPKWREKHLSHHASSAHG
jgi:hypothetical protein